MSIISSLLIFLCLSLHACNARHLGVVDKDSSTQVHFLRKEIVKNRFDKTSVLSKPSSSNEPKKSHQQSKNGESMIHESWSGASSKKLKNPLKGVIKNRREILGGGLTESHVSFSWRVPHEKQREHPGFNADYAPPKTHPPSHN